MNAGNSTHRDSDRHEVGRAEAVERQPIASEALFGGAKEILIRHGETIYRLRITSKDKLILTK